ncbi:MAG: hypothetical protein OXJ62_16540, partial [Spirochaetaceae bacterium]|nr:hypothetical protein [Spirochaetaceae bacterium]
MQSGNHVPSRRRRRALAARPFAGMPLLAAAALLLLLPPALAQQPADRTPAENAATVRARRAMVDRQLRARDIDDPRVLEVMAKVPRHLFVPERMQGSAYRDSALPIDDGQTISQP